MTNNDDVLLVDGDPCALGLMAHGLARQGLQVRPVAKSGQAMDELSKTLPSLVISDVEESGADGLHLLDLMRRNPRTADIPVLLLAKGEWKGRRIEAQRLGAQDLLRKPLFVQDLAALGRLYAGHSATEEVLSGNLEDLPCLALLRSLLAGGRSGQLSFDPAGGRIYFQEGRVVDAVLPPLQGERALWRLLTFNQGRYRLRFGPVERPASLAIDVQELQSRGAEHIRRWDELRTALGSTDAILEVDFRSLGNRIEQVSPAVLPLLRLFDGQRSVAQAIDAFGLDDLVGAQALIKLNSIGLLRPAGASAPVPAEESLSPLGVAVAIGQSRESSFDTLAKQATQDERDPSKPLALSSPQSGRIEGRADEMADGLEASFFRSAAPAEAPTHKRDAPVAPWLQRLAVSALIGAVAGGALIVTFRSTSSPAEPAAPAVALPPAPSPIAAPPSITELPPSTVAVDRGPEAEALVQAGQKAYDAGQFAQAAQSFQKAAQLEPRDPVARMYLGLSLYEQGKLGRAVDSLQEALTLEPKNGRTELLLGAVYQELGKKDRARESYERYLELDPSGPYVAEVRTILGALHAAR